MHQYDIRDLRIHFPTRRGVVEAVRGVSFYMDQGECVALVGESGSGKSISARALMGLVRKPGIVSANRLNVLGNDLLTKS